MKRNKMTVISKRSVFALITCMLLILSACSNKESSNQDQVSQDGSHIQVVTSFYPIYYLTKTIGGEHVNVTNLVATGVEPHDWTPKSKDLLTATNADLLLYHGAGLETWIDDFKKGINSNSNVIIKEVSTGIKLIDSASSDDDHGAEDEHEAEETHDHESEEAHNHDSEDDGHTHSYTVDPHTWVSPKSALILASNIKDQLVEVDAEHAADFEKNYEQLEAKLKSIDEQYREQLGALSNRTIVVSHQSFGYMARDYNLEQISIMGLNPSSEPRAQDILKIAHTVKEKGVKYIFFEELVSDNLAKMLASEAKVDTMVLYSLEGLTTTQEKAGEDYISLMETNLQNLVQALQ